MSETKLYNGNKYSGQLLGACLDGYKQGQQDEKRRILNKLRSSDKFFGNYIDIRDLVVAIVGDEEYEE